MDKLNHFLHYISYKLLSRHKRGFGIHSPFLFRLIQECFNESPKTDSLDRALAYRESQLSSQETVNYSSAGANEVGEKKEKIQKLARKSSVNNKYGILLYKLVRYFSPDEILEFGTSIGISTAFLCSAKHEGCKIVSVEACKNTSEYAKRMLNKAGFTGVETVNERIEEYIVSQKSSPDLVYIDANHTFKGTMDIFQYLLKNVNNNSVLIFDDIYWSKEMVRIWKYIKQHSSVTMTIDLFRFGLVFVDKRLYKENFVIRY
jgi:predicted O-methyltransferase YrrM